MPAILDMIYSGNAPVDATRSYVHYFPNSNRLALPELNGVTMLMAAVQRHYSAPWTIAQSGFCKYALLGIGVADAWEDAYTRTQSHHDNRTMNETVLASSWDSLRKQRPWLVTQLLLTLENTTSGDDDTTRAREQAGWIQTALSDCV